VTAPDRSSYDYFGVSVRIGTDALAVGAFRDSVGYSNSGSAYVFRRLDASTWTLEAKLISGDGGEDEYFGVVVDVDKSDSLVAVAAFGDDGGRGLSPLSLIHHSPAPGAVYLFSKAAPLQRWTQLAKLVASDPFSSSVLPPSLCLLTASVQDSGE
jgi:hypothetical protein